jgi:hypothetical protein
MLKTLIAGAGLALLTALPAFAACTDISSKTIALSGCVDGEWQPIEGTGAQEFSYLTADQNFGLMLITEKETIPATQFRDAIIQNAIKGSGGTADDVKIVRERKVSIDGKSFDVVEYTSPTTAIRSCSRTSTTRRPTTARCRFWLTASTLTPPPRRSRRACSRAPPRSAASLK